MDEIYENDWESCKYCECTYREDDIGYREYGCSLITGDANDYDCVGCDIDDGCPLSFKYTIKENDRDEK